MIDINFLRQNPDKVKKSAESKGIDINIAHVAEIDLKYREILSSVQKLREDRNRFAKEKNIEEGRRIKDQLEKEEQALNAIKGELESWIFKIPNLPKDDVKNGKDETENEIVRKVGTPRKFNFPLKDHLALAEALDIIDVKQAAKISGTRFYFLKNEAVILQFALRQFAFDTLTKQGFIPVLPPVLIKEDVMRGLGYMEKGGDEDMYIFEKDKMVFVGTSEQSLVPMHKDEILNAKDLPKRYVGFSTCFRREAGSYGKDTRGILRTHQFDKTEMVSFVKQGEDDKEHEYLLSIEEKFLQELELPYQVVKMCTGDLGFPTARKYDLEGWIPSEAKYRELTSASTTTDFQARRLNIKYRDGDQNHYVNILNGTAFSTRPLVAIIENFQEEDGSIIIPEVLKKYTGFEKIGQKKQL